MRFLNLNIFLIIYSSLYMVNVPYDFTLYLISNIYVTVKSNYTSEIIVFVFLKHNLHNYIVWSKKCNYYFTLNE